MGSISALAVDSIEAESDLFIAVKKLCAAKPNQRVRNVIENSLIANSAIADSSAEGDDKNSRFGSFNGTIIALDDGGEDIKMFFSNNSLKLKETEWFSAMRRMPAAWAAG